MAAYCTPRAGLQGSGHGWRLCRLTHAAQPAATCCCPSRTKPPCPATAEARRARRWPRTCTATATPTWPCYPLRASPQCASSAHQAQPSPHACACGAPPPRAGHFAQLAHGRCRVRRCAASPATVDRLCWPPPRQAPGSRELVLTTTRWSSQRHKHSPADAVHAHAGRRPPSARALDRLHNCTPPSAKASLPRNRRRAGCRRHQPGRARCAQPPGPRAPPTAVAATVRVLGGTLVSPPGGQWSGGPTQWAMVGWAPGRYARLP